MRQEVFEIVQKMDKDNIRTQMALQCAPLITGLKVANLLIIPSKNEKYVGAILDGTDISYIRLAKSECKTTFFLYREERLTALCGQRTEFFLLRRDTAELSYQIFFKQFRCDMKLTCRKGKLFPMRLVFC